VEHVEVTLAKETVPKEIDDADIQTDGNQVDRDYQQQFNESENDSKSDINPRNNGQQMRKGDQDLSSKELEEVSHFLVTTTGYVHSTQMLRLFIGHSYFFSNICFRFDVFMPPRNFSAML